jgi:hypothetical protein
MVELILCKENCTRLEAHHIAYNSCVWGGVHLPLVTGTAHEDINIEYDNMLQSHAESDHGPESTSNRKKQKRFIPGEKKASPKQIELKRKKSTVL